MNDGGLGADTEVVLLLCGRFGGERKEPHAPLTATEYGALARWLKERQLRPLDMLTDVGKAHFGELVQARLDRSRIEFLLGRGTALALSVERWQRAGLWVISRADAAYPQRYRQLFRHVAPPLLFGAGDSSLLAWPGLAIVGARNASDEALSFAARAGERCAREGISVVSGGARGVDSVAMQSATNAGGFSVGVLACDLLKTSMNRTNRSAIQAGRLLLISPFSPEAGFNSGNAMARNRLIYALAGQALVIDSTAENGGTWAGATENLRHGWVPLFVRIPAEGGGNDILLGKGARAFEFDLSSTEELRGFLDTSAAQAAREPEVTIPSLVEVSVEGGVPGEVKESAAADYPQLDETNAKPEASAPISETVLSPQTLNPDEPRAVELTSPAPALLDMYPAFLSRMEVLLRGGMGTEDEVSLALGLDTKQAKVWLKQAAEEGRLTKKMAVSKSDGKKRAHYTLNPQAALC